MVLYLPYPEVEQEASPLCLSHLPVVSLRPVCPVLVGLPNRFASSSVPLVLRLEHMYRLSLTSAWADGMYMDFLPEVDGLTVPVRPAKGIFRRFLMKTWNF